MDEEFAREAIRQNSTIGQMLETAHYLWRVSPKAIRLVLDDRVSDHLNVFCRMELAGLETALIWGRHFERLLQKAEINSEGPDTNEKFGPQMAWLEENDCMFPVPLAMAYFRKRREFAEQEKLVGKRDLYNYVRHPENKIYGFDLEITDDDPSLKLERRNIHRALYNDVSENMVFRLTRQIISANGGGSPIDW